MESVILPIDEKELNSKGKLVYTTNAKRLRNNKIRRRWRLEHKESENKRLEKYYVKYKEERKVAKDARKLAKLNNNAVDKLVADVVQTGTENEIIKIQI